MGEIKTRDDVTLHVEEHRASGRPVVLIHGWPLSGQSWEKQLGALTGAGYRVVTYDRRGFGRSDKPDGGYDYDTLADDLADVMETLDLQDATLVGFSMGGGEVARYIARSGEDRLHSVVFAAAVPPCMLKSEDNPDGPLPQEGVDQMQQQLRDDRESFFDGFTTDFYSVDGELKVTEEERNKAIDLARQSDHDAALACIESFGTTDFRDDLTKVSVPTLVVHGDSDSIVPLEGSGARTDAAIDSSSLVVLKGAPHGLITSHANEFNEALLAFLAGSGGTEHAAGAAGPAG